MSNRFEVTFPAGRLDLELCLTSGQVFRWELLPDGSWRGVDGDYWYVARHEGPRAERQKDALTYDAGRRIAFVGDIEQLSVESNGSQERFVELFRLDWDADAIEREISKKAPEMRPYLGTHHGLRLMKPSSAPETFYCFLCTPNNNIARIGQMVRALAAYGSPLDEVAGHRFSKFPSSATIAAIPEAELRAKAFGYRAATITGAARQVLEKGGDAWIETLRTVPYEEARSELLSIKGIGPKLADCIALFALHHTESVPIDTHIWKAATRLYFPEWKDKPLTEIRYRAVGDHLRSRFGKLAGWAQQYLFMDNVLNWRSRK